eukprot:COSAG06_NODE_796_length_12220_cov_4.708522_8_plen_171_part_00
MLLRSEHLDELLAMQPTAEIDSAMADLAEALLRGVTETVAAEVPRKLGTIVHKSIPTLIQAVDLYREVEGQLSISSRNFLLHSLRSIILMLQADDDLDKLSQAINDDAARSYTTRALSQPSLPQPLPVSSLHRLSASCDRMSQTMKHTCTQFFFWGTLFVSHKQACYMIL